MISERSSSTMCTHFHSHGGCVIKDHLSGPVTRIALDSATHILLGLAMVIVLPLKSRIRRSGTGQYDEGLDLNRKVFLY